MRLTTSQTNNINKLFSLHTKHLFYSVIMSRFPSIKNYSFNRINYRVNIFHKKSRDTSYTDSRGRTVPDPSPDLPL